MLLPTILIIAVNLALGFLAAVGRERMLVLRAAEAVGAVDSAPEVPVEAVAPSQPAPAVAGPEPQAPAEPQPAPDAIESSSTDFVAPVPQAAAEPKDEPPVDGLPVDGPRDEASETRAEEQEEPAAESLAAGAESAGEPEATDDPFDAGESDDTGDDAIDDAPQTVSVDSAAASASTELPSEWFDLLENIEREGYGKCQSFVEASTQVLRLEVGRYRGELVEIDNRVRAIFGAFQPEALAAALGDLDRINSDWLLRQNEAVGHLAARRDQLGDFQATGQRLEDVLLDQTAQIESSQTNLRQIDLSADANKLQRPVLVEIGRLLDMAHALRDQLQESLLAIVMSENRVATLDRRLHVDALTGFVNRTGLEVVLYEWWRDDPHRIRPLSFVMFDVVRTGRFNERHGVSVGDAMLAAVGKIVDGTLRKKRGCDLVGRYSGQRFVVLLGDTGPQNAASAAERIRQGVAASAFEIAGENESAQVTVSCGVVEVHAADDSRAVVRRLEAATALAKKLGRNTTCLDRGNGPAAIENPPDYQAKGKIVRLNA